MFTGLIQDIGTIMAIDKAGDWRVKIRTKLDLSQIRPGASMACAGICLSVIGLDDTSFDVQVSEETRRITEVELWETGTRLNLETSLKLGDEIGGHFVFGHVDGLATLEEVYKVSESHLMRFKIPAECESMLASKGSVSLDGVSLTINNVSKDDFTVNIIPHTWDHTTLKLLQPGDNVHFEADMLARYVARQTELKT